MFNTQSTKVHFSDLAINIGELKDITIAFWGILRSMI